MGICSDVCRAGGKTEDCAAAFDEAAIANECSTSFYSSPPQCVREGLMQSDGDGGYWWKVGLGIGCAAAFLIILGLVIRHHRKENATEEQIAKYDAKKAREAEKRKQKESSKKDRSRRSTPRNAEVEPASRGEGQSVAPSSVANNSDALRLADVELTACAPLVPHTESNPASPARSAKSKRSKKHKHGAASSSANSTPDRSTRSVTAGIDSATPPVSRVQRALLSGVESEGGAAASHAEGVPAAAAASSSSPPPPRDGVSSFVLHGDEDAWKKGLPIRVAPPEQ